MWLNNFNIFDLARKIKRPLLLDGAMGSLLQMRGLKRHTELWMCHANITAPDCVMELHNEYIYAGADIITTNTFRTNFEAFKKSDLNISYESLVRQSVSLALQAKGNNPILIAGSNPPAEDSYSNIRTLSHEDLYDNHYKHILNLADSGVDFILNETQGHFDEIKIICEICSRNNIPFVVSLYFDQQYNLLSGESFENAVRFVQEFNPLAISINCIKPIIPKKLEVLAEHNWGAYFNIGSSSVNAPSFTEVLKPVDYVSVLKKYRSDNPSFIGACCGSTPFHIAAIKEYLDEIY